jgi:hypothetical protein
MFYGWGHCEEIWNGSDAKSNVRKGFITKKMEEEEQRKANDERREKN